MKRGSSKYCPCDGHHMMGEYLGKCVQNYFFFHRKAYERSLESIRASLETEVKDKAQAVYMRKKLEADIHQLEVSLKRTKETNTDLQKAYERIQSENEDQQARLEDSERLVAQQQEQLRVLERRVGSVMAELEEAHTLLEQADRSRRSVGVKLSEADDYIRKLTSENESLLASKERLDDELQNIQVSHHIHYVLLQDVHEIFSLY